MAKPSLSIGDDTPTGEPDNGPRGPYITDKDDGTDPPAAPRKAPSAPEKKPRSDERRRKQRPPT